MQMHAEKSAQKSVRLGGDFARDIYESSGTGIMTRRRTMNRSTSLCRFPTNRVPTSGAIAAGKYRLNKFDRIDDDPFTSIEYLSRSAFGKCIRGLSLIPFYVMYTSVDQIVMYNIYKKKNKITKVSADSTGSIAHKIVREGRKSQQIHLYTLVISDGFQIPVHSMITDAHNTSLVSYWLREFVRFTGDTPNVFICDMSSVLLNSAAREFAKCDDISEYAEILFNMHTEPNIKIPKCYIRCDRNHFIKLVASCDALKEVSALQKQFYIRSVCLLMNCRRISQAEMILLSILTVAKSEFKGEEADSLFKVRRQRLFDMIGTMPDFSKEENISIQSCCSPEKTDLGITSSRIKDWLKEMDVQSITERYDGEKNNLFNEKFAKYLLSLSETLVLWSGINAQFFNADVSASSANVESYFKDLKSSIPHLPCRADVFMQEHIEMINGMIVDASQEYVNFVDASGGLEKFRKDIPIVPIDDSENESEPETSEINEVFGYTQVNSFSALGDQPELIDSSMQIAQQNTCVACKLGDLPGGAHTCIKCMKAIHVIDGCSYSAGQEEGYGEKRVCYSCYFEKFNEDETKSKANPRKKNPKNEKSVSKVLNAQDKWAKTKRSQRSYLRPLPHLGLMTSEKKTPKIGFLINATAQTTVHKVNGVPVKLKNTCAFDSVVQLLAIVYAYNPKVRSAFDEYLEYPGIEIATMLAKNVHMRSINKKRAEIVSRIMDDSDGPITANYIFSVLMKECPSYKETTICSDECINEPKYHPIIK
ncbi:uncharacterized protein LOC129572793, partial [Sitodiplosis mosellana]|uniref:uncharacterized protein LOC129572793 n=1 Tax=Sitodiplosis mosellana TaxID=263140 RepID=UPI002444CD96